MIDFVATRETTDVETKACARLLTAVIASAIKDLATELSHEEKKQRMNLKADVNSAFKFLFDEDSPFDLYASLIGSSAEDIRKKIKEIDPSKSWGCFTSSERHRIYHRVRMHELRTTFIQEALRGKAMHHRGNILQPSR